jgi:hypothetical protein
MGLFKGFMRSCGACVFFCVGEGVGAGGHLTGRDTGCDTGCDTDTKMALGYDFVRHESN